MAVFWPTPVFKQNHRSVEVLRPFNVRLLARTNILHVFVIIKIFKKVLTFARSTIGDRNGAAQHACRSLDFAQISIGDAVGAAHQSRRIGNIRFDGWIVRWTIYRAHHTMWHQILIFQAMLTRWTLDVFTRSWKSRNRSNSIQLLWKIVFRC